MPKIKGYESQVNASGRGVSSGINVDSVAAPYRAAQKAIGAAVEFGSELNQLEQRNAQAEISDLNANFAEAREEWQTRIQEDTRNGSLDVDKVKTDYAEFVNKMNTGIETEAGRKFFERQASRIGGQVLRTAGRAQIELAGKRAEENWKSALDRSSNSLQKDPTQFDDIYGSAIEAIDAQVEVGAIPAGLADRFKRETGKELAKNTVRGLINKNPSAAKKALDKGVYDSYLDPDAKQQMYNSAESEIKSRKDMFQKVLELKNKDPWAFLGKTGEAAGAKPLSFGADASRSFKERSEFVSDMSRKHGIRVPFLSDNEADALVTQFSQKQPKEAVALFQNLDTQVSEQNKYAFASAIYKKDPTLAGALMISGDAPDDARKIVAGRALLTSGGEGVGKAIKAPTDAKVAAAFDAYVGSSVEDPTARIAARQAIAAHMVKSMFDKGDSDFDEFTLDSFEASAAAVIGPKIKLRDQGTLSFRGKNGQFLEENDFLDLVYGLNDKQIESIQGDVPRTMNGEPINMAKSRGRISLKPVGDGLYFVLRDEVPAWNRNKLPFVLDLKSIEKAKPENKTTPILDRLQDAFGVK